MKRSKAFLAFTGVILIIAGVASAKDCKWSRKFVGFFTSARNNCTQLSQTSGVTKNVPGRGAVLHTTTARGIYTVWTKSEFGPCVGNTFYTFYHD